MMGNVKANSKSGNTMENQELGEKEAAYIDDEDREDDEEEYSDYIEQDDLETVKEWLEVIRQRRTEEADTLEDELTLAIADLEEFEEDLKDVLKWKRKKHLDTMNGSVSEYAVDIERYRRMLREKRDTIKRRLRDLVRQDREDLEWTWKLERNQRNSERQERESDWQTRREREPDEEYRPASKSQQRAANWKQNKGKAKNQPTP